MCLAGCTLILVLLLAVGRCTRDLLSSGVARHADMIMTVMKFLLNSFQETGGTECHAGPHREAAGLGERQEEGEDSSGESLSSWYSWERRSEAGYERQTD